MEADYDYTPDDIASVVLTLKMCTSPDPHLDAAYIVNLKDGRTCEEVEGQIRGLLCVQACLLSLAIKGELSDPTPEAPAHPWRTHGV